MRRVLAATAAEFLEFQPLGRCFPVLGGRIIPLFAIAALQRNNLSGHCSLQNKLSCCLKSCHPERRSLSPKDLCISCGADALVRAVMRRSCSRRGRGRPRHREARSELCPEKSLHYSAVIAKSGIIRPPRTGRRRRNGWSSKNSAAVAASTRRTKK